MLVQDGRTSARALAALDLGGVTVVHIVRPAEGIPSLAFADMVAPRSPAEVAELIAKTTPQTLSKPIFTSGSVGMPKAVINAQQMMCANVAMASQVRRPPADQAAVYLDRLRWNHPMGGNAL